MTIGEHQTWLVDFYRSRQWYDLSYAIRLNFLSEEVGEVSQALRAFEIGRDHPGEPSRSLTDKENQVREELADVLDQVLILAAKYGMTPTDLIKQSETKLAQRFIAVEEPLE